MCSYYQAKAVRIEVPAVSAKDISEAHRTVSCSKAVKYFSCIINIDVRLVLKQFTVTQLIKTLLSDFVVLPVLLSFLLNPATGTSPQPAEYYLPFHAVFAYDIPYA